MMIQQRSYLNHPEMPPRREALSGQDSDAGVEPAGGLRELPLLGAQAHL